MCYENGYDDDNDDDDDDDLEKCFTSLCTLQQITSISRVEDGSSAEHI